MRKPGEAGLWCTVLGGLQGGEMPEYKIVVSGPMSDSGSCEGDPLHTAAG